MSYESVIKELRNGILHPVYFLHGEEPYYIDKVSEFIEENILTDSEKAFNQLILYGKDVEASTIIDEARQYPMMSSKRVILLKEAQEMKSLPELLPYLENPAPSTILVICHKYNKIDKRTKFAKIMEQKALVFESKRIYENQVPVWVKEYIKSLGYQAVNGVAELLTEYLGADLGKISNELDKLILNVSKSNIISIEDVKEQIGISKEYDVFELQKMLGARDYPKAVRIINYLADNQTSNPPVMVISNIFSYFNKVMLVRYHGSKSDFELSRLTGVNSFFIKEYRNAAKNYSILQLIHIFHSLKAADKASKGIGTRRADVISVYKDLVISCIRA